MNQRTMEWIDAALEGSLAPENHSAFQQMLRDDPLALDYYCQQAELHGRLEWELRAVADPAGVLPVAPKKVRPFPRIIRQVAAAAALLSLGAFGGYMLRPKTSAPQVSDVISQPPVEYVARLIQENDAKWSEGDPRVGEWLPSGPMELLEGSAQIAFDSGASVRLQAPAKIFVSSPVRARLDFGKSIVDIPELAVGFVVETPTAEFLRKGSRFGLAVEEDGRSEIHVINGEVELSSKRGSRHSLKLAKDKTARVGDSGVVGEEPRYALSDFGKVVLPDSALMPKTFLHWDFNAISPTENLFHESGPHDPSESAYPASIVNVLPDGHASLVPGQFGSAVKLDGGCVLSTKFPGYRGNAPRSIAFWVMISPNVADQFAYSMLSWGCSRPQEGGKWQIAWNSGKDNSGKKGAIRTEIQGGYSIGSTDLRDGKWHHVAVVYPGGVNASVSSIRYYIDGKLDAITAVKEAVINTRIDLAESYPLTIGHRVDEGGGYNSFKGSIDELYVFPVALLPSQIEDLFLDNVSPGLK